MCVCVTFNLWKLFKCFCNSKLFLDIFAFTANSQTRVQKDRFQAQIWPCRKWSPAAPSHKCFIYLSVYFNAGQRQTLHRLLPPARPNHLAGLIITSRNAAWSLGRWELIALDHNELLENRFVWANYFPGKYPLPSLVLCLKSDPEAWQLIRPPLMRLGLHIKWFLWNTSKSPPSKSSRQPPVSWLIENMILPQ